MEEIYGPGEIRVNSYHHQGIRKLAPIFRVAALAPDGLIEAFEGKDPSWWVTGVQWHPENEGSISLDTQLIEAFTEAALARSGPFRPWLGWAEDEGHRRSINRGKRDGDWDGEDFQAADPGSFCSWMSGACVDDRRARSVGPFPVRRSSIRKVEAATRAQPGSDARPGLFSMIEPPRRRSSSFTRTVEFRP